RFVCVPFPEPNARRDACPARIEASMWPTAVMEGARTAANDCALGARRKGAGASGRGDSRATSTRGVWGGDGSRLRPSTSAAPSASASTSSPRRPRSGSGDGRDASSSGGGGGDVGGDARPRSRREAAGGGGVVGRWRTPPGTSPGVDGGAGGG